MPQPPAASQPPPFSTPDPSRFRGSRQKRSEREGMQNDGSAPERRTTTPASAAARPTPRFAPSRPGRQPGQSQLPSQSRSHATPQLPSTVRKFSFARAINSGSRSVSRSGTSIGSAAASRRFLSHAPLLHGGDDIEDGSSPPQPSTQREDRREDEEEGIPMVVRESPTATRTSQTSSTQPLPPALSRPGAFSAGNRRRQRSGLDEDIEDVAPSREKSGTADGDDIVRESGDTLEATDNDTQEILMPDSVPEDSPEKLPLKTPAPQIQKAQHPARRQSSAARLLSSIQPLKRRRLFVSPGLITSSPPGLELDHNEEAEKETDEMGVEEDHDRSAHFVPRFRTKKSRHAWEGDDIVDDESDESDGVDNVRYGNEEVRDIVDYGELLEYSDSSDDGNGGGKEKSDDHDEMMDDYHDEDDDEDMILDQTPPRIRLARLRRQEEKQQRIQEQKQQQQQRLPTFQRARLFMTARRPTNEDEAGENPEGEMNEDLGLSQDFLTTPARQQHYYDAILHQPPPDFFSPQKKRRQKRPRRSRHSNGSADDVLDGLGGLTSPSAAAAAATAAAINAPEQYVPGGLAASLRDWLVQVKSGGHGPTTTATSAQGKFVVDEMRQAPGMMQIALGRRLRTDHARGDGDAETTEIEPVRLLLTGEGRQWSNGRDIALNTMSDKESKETIVSISHPAWEINLGGQPWIVASDWSMHEE